MSRRVASCTSAALIVSAAIATSSASLVAMSPGASASTGPSLVAVGTVLPRLWSSREMGALAPDRVLSLGVALRPKDPRAMRNFVNEVVTPGSSRFHRFLSPGSFASRFGPAISSVDLVESDLRASGLKVGVVSTNRLVIPVHGTVRAIDAAFHTDIVGYRLANGRLGWAATSAPEMARSVAQSVSAVLGLDNVAVPHSHLSLLSAHRAGDIAGTLRSVSSSKAGAPTACVAAADRASSDGGWTESQIAQAYGLDGLFAHGALGAGETIGVLELEPYQQSDIATFDRCFFGPGHLSTLRNIPVDGFNLSGSGAGESILDIEILSALAPRAAIDVYEAPNTSYGPIDAYNAMVSGDKANVISSGWGECETAIQIGAPGTQQIENYIFEEAAAQGQTVFASSGDTGSDDCAGTQFGSTKAEPPYLSVDDPASQPYVVGVGGTSLRSDMPPLLAANETVWNDGSSGGGSGGGISGSWASPAWQAQSGVPGTQNASGRLVPDVSASADEQHGTTIYSASFARGSGSSTSATAGWATIGGTSASAPMWAAIVTDIASSSACSALPTTAGGPDLGFVAPELYAVASATYASSFNDITTGDNDVFHLGQGYQAAPGFNLAAGLGSPIVTDASGTGGLAAALCAVATNRASAIPTPVLTGVAASFGPTSGGNTVTLTGSGFAPSTGANVAVDFGSAVATVDSVTATEITVTAPSSVLAPHSPSTGAAGSVDVTVTVTDASGSTTSPTSAATVYAYVDESTPGIGVPSVAGIGPSGGNLAGGNTVTIWGSGFSVGGSIEVAFGGVASPSVSILRDDEIKAVVPPASPATACATGNGFDPAAVCQVGVVVTTSNGSSATAPILPPASGTVVFGPQGVIEPSSGSEAFSAATEYDYAPTPQITSITPNPTNGTRNLPVVISGTGFSLLTLDWVNFGAATSVESEETKVLSVTPTSIAIAPPMSNASRSDSVSLRGGVSVQSAAGLSNVAPFSYAGTPLVTRLGSLGGSIAGGTRLRIHGAGLADVISVTFIGELTGSRVSISTGRSIVQRSNSSLTVVVPPDLAGPVAVVPCSIAHCARSNRSVDTFVYFDQRSRTLAAIVPDSGPAHGGSTVVLFGDGVGRSSAVTFDGVAATPATSSSAYPTRDPYVEAVVAPPGADARRVPITARVVTPNASATLHGVFRYLPSAPSAPQSVSIKLSIGSATVSWNPPRSDGGSTLTGYIVVVASPGLPTRRWSLSNDVRSATLVGLVAGHPYTVTIAAVNLAHGRGDTTTLQTSIPTS